MPILLVCSFFVTSLGLASLVFAVASFPRPPSRPVAAYFLLAVAVWLLALRLGVSVFSWHIGIPHHRWFKTLASLALRAAWTLVPLAGMALTWPRPGEPRRAPGRAAFAFSAILAAVAAAASLSVIPPLTRLLYERGDALWPAAAAYASTLAIVTTRGGSPGQAGKGRRSGRVATVACLACAGLMTAALPAVFRILSLNEDAAVLAVSSALSIATFVFIPFSKRNARIRGKKPHFPDLDGTGPLGMLSAREAEIAILLAEGKTNAEIARDLFISTKTVETHISNMFRKTGVSNRVQLARTLLEGPRG